jgi:hypothetical protein
VDATSDCHLSRPTGTPRHHRLHTPQPHFPLTLNTSNPSTPAVLPRRRMAASTPLSTPGKMPAVAPTPGARNQPELGARSLVLPSPLANSPTSPPRASHSVTDHGSRGGLEPPPGQLWRLLSHFLVTNPWTLPISSL